MTDLSATQTGQLGPDHVMGRSDANAVGVPALQIRHVGAQQFGKWTNHDLALPNSSFIVIHGPNSAGKSTFATLMRWLLVGPGDLKPSDTEHLGDYGETLSGAMECLLDSRPVITSGKFRLLKRGAPATDFQASFVANRDHTDPASIDLTFADRDRARSDSADLTSAHLDPAHLDLAAWLGQLRGVDPSVMSAVYYLWGPDLDDVSDLDSQLARISMGHLKGRDPRGIIDTLTDQARKATRSGGRNDVSVKSLGTQMRSLRASLSAAAENVNRYETLRRDIEQLIAQVEAVRIRRQESDELRRRIRQAIEAMDTATQVRQLTKQLHESAEPSQPWLSAMRERSTLAQLNDQLNTLESQVRAAQDSAHAAAMAAGCDIEFLSALSITDADTADAARLAAELRHCRSTVDERSDRLRQVADHLSERQTAARAAMLRLPGIDQTDVRTCGLDTQRRDAIGRLILQAQSAAVSASEAAQHLTVAFAGLDRVNKEHQTAVDRWGAFGGSTPPDVWIRQRLSDTPASLPHPRSDHRESHRQTGLKAWVGTVALIVVAVAAAAARQWPLGVIAVVLALANAVVQRPWRSSTLRTDASRSQSPSQLTGQMTAEGSDPAFSPQETAVGVVFETAKAVIDAQTRLREAEIEVSARQQSADQTQDSAVHADQALRERAVGFGIRLEAPLDMVEDELRSWSAASYALEALDAAEQQHLHATIELGHASDSLGEVIAAILALMDRLGLPTVQDPSTVEVVVGTFKNASLKVRALESAISRFDSLHSDWLRVIAPLTLTDPEVGDWSRSRLLDRLDEVNVENSRRTAVVARLAEQRTRLEQPMEDPIIRTLLDSGSTLAELESKLAEAELEVDTTDSEYQAVNRQIGVLQGELQAIEAESEIAALRDRIGGLTEQQSEVLVEGAASLLAAKLLRQVADGFQRKNQPAVVKQASVFAQRVTKEWDQVQIMARESDDSAALMVRTNDRNLLPAVKLSTGARGLLQLCLRLSLAEQDRTIRGLSVPLICDDPLVHLSDDWAESAMRLLGEASGTRQVIYFTCHRRSVDSARSLGADIVELT